MRVAGMTPMAVLRRYLVLLIVAAMLGEAVAAV